MQWADSRSEMVAFAHRWLVAAMWLLACLIAWPAKALQLADDRGVMVELPRPAQRVITLLPSLTETVCELGACDRLVGVDSYSNWPARVQSLPRLGGVDHANIELILSLKPDLVLLSSTSRALQRLESLGVKVFGADVKTLEDVHRALANTAVLLALPGAEGAWQCMNAGIDEAARGIPASARGQSVYFEVDVGPYAASEISHIGQLLARLGAVNIVPGSLGSIPHLNPEFVVRADPQVIIVGASGGRSLAQRPGWSRIRAVRDGRVCTLTPQQDDAVARPGPRLAEAARALAQCLQMPVRARP
jgi:iron complex transport system substrate-binding protein